MRTQFLLVSLVAMLAACSEQQQPTSPTTAARTEPRSGDYSAAANTAGGAPQAKPVDQVGFSKAVTIFSDPLYVPAGQLAAGEATCPTGSFAIGGGHSIFLTGGVKVLSSHPDVNAVGDIPRAWTLTMDNTTGATQAGFRVWAVCVS